jgi:phosphonatase-like hydrolase
MNPTIALVVLDMAGTTVQDTGQVPDAFAAALASFDVHVTASEITRVRGASKRRAIRDLLEARGVPLHLCDEVYEAFRVNLEHRYSHSAQPIRGARDTMRWLRQQGIRVALNTGFDRPTTVALLRALGWSQGVADAVVCGDDVAQGRPSAEMILRCMEIIGIRDTALVANVGDTVLDLRAGHDAGVRYNIGVLSGAHRREVLEAEPHTHVIASVAELPSVIAPA